MPWSALGLTWLVKLPLWYCPWICTPCVHVDHSPHQLTEVDARDSLRFQPLVMHWLGSGWGPMPSKWFSGPYVAALSIGLKKCYLQEDHTYCKIGSRRAGMPQIQNTGLRFSWGEEAQHRHIWSVPLICTRAMLVCRCHEAFGHLLLGRHHWKQTKLNRIWVLHSGNCKDDHYHWEALFPLLWCLQMVQTVGETVAHACGGKWTNDGYWVGKNVNVISSVTNCVALRGHYIKYLWLKCY